MNAIAKLKQPAPTIRAATRDDAATILGFIRELAEYEKLSHEVMADEKSIERNLFGPMPYAECLIAEVNGIPAGFALFFHNFSTFLGKPGVYVEDVYVNPAFRGEGLGKMFFQTLAHIAIERDCGRMEWSVLDWNDPAIKFYQKIGAKPMSEWTVQRLTHEQLKDLVSA